MQTGLRPYVQDENALAGLHRPAAVKAGGGALGGAASLPDAKGLAKATPGFPGLRKALGNITNRGHDAENAPPGKTPAGAGPAPARRALGNITNSAAPSSSMPHGMQQKAAAALQQPLAEAAAAAQPPSRADLLAEGGVERCFGQGWEELERGRVAREDEESTARLAALASYPARGLPNFFPLWVGAAAAPAGLHVDYHCRCRRRCHASNLATALPPSPLVQGAGISQQQALQKDALPPLPASPVSARPPSAASLALPDTSGALDLPTFAFGTDDLGDLPGWGDEL